MSAPARRGCLAAHPRQVKHPIAAWIAARKAGQSARVFPLSDWKKARQPLIAIALVFSGCKASPPPPAELQLSTDLPEGTVDRLLANVAAQGGPRGERVAGLGLGVTALDGGGGAANAGDLRWDLEPYGAIAAAARGELETMPVSGADVPELWRDPGATWVAVGGRAEVLLVATGSIGEHPSPQKLLSLTEPWLKGRVALVQPAGGAALAHFAALYQAWGEARMRGWLDGLHANDVQLFATDAEVRAAVVEGRAWVGLLASDEAAKAAASAARVEVVYPNQRSIGVFVWPTALSRPKSSAHAGPAAQLAEKLADRSAEQLLVAREPGFLPLRPGIPTPPGVRSAANLVVISVEPARIVAEIAGRREELNRWISTARK